MTSRYSRQRAKRRYRYAPIMAWSPYAVEDDDEIKDYKAQQFFDWMIRQAKTLIYRNVHGGGSYHFKTGRPKGKKVKLKYS